jgi:hypothetical protein
MPAQPTRTTVRHDRHQTRPAPAAPHERPVRARAGYALPTVREITRRAVREPVATW